MTASSVDSSLSLVENGGQPPETTTNTKRSRNRPNRGVFDAAAATEDDPLLLQEPLLLPSNLNNTNNLPSSLSSFQPPEPPPQRHHHHSNKRTFQTSRKQKKRTVQYESDNHCSVLFSMYGSVWPHVLPYCCVSVVITGLIAYAGTRGVDLTFASSTGHTFMAIMVSFLVVTRANITYARFMEARDYLSQCYRACRELMQHVCILTMTHFPPPPPPPDDDDEYQHDLDKQEHSHGASQQELRAQEWRRNVAYRTILLLRVTMAAIEFRSSSINTWDVMEGDQDVADMQLMTPTAPAHRRISSVMPASTTEQAERMASWAHGERTMADENFRAPIVLAYNLRQVLLEQRDGTWLQERMHVNEEMKLLGFVSDFVTAFHGLKKLITTPFPFPLVQMNRTFLFFWVFSLPLVLMHDIQSPFQVMVIMFFVTYGFIGLEYVSMELDDPFGDDPNDFDDLGMAEIVFEDIYITLLKRDGMESAEALRAKVAQSEGRGESLLENFRSTYGESLHTIGEDDDDRAA